ncbi:hypothetical protein pb186bvf_020312 [Paramecium bursaria]
MIYDQILNIDRRVSIKWNQFLCLRMKGTINTKIFNDIYDYVSFNNI